VQLAADTELALFRITQEALTNCAKHAQATHISVALQIAGWPVQLTVSDDGIGFDATGVHLPDENGRVVGQGLRQMSQTAEFLDGHLALDSAPGRGTRIRVDIPQPLGVPKS
jgi:signal transduction histidine kinase